MKDGYAPFCKHIFVENFTSSKSYYLPITSDNSCLIRTDYYSWADYELPVLRRFFQSDKVETKKALYLDVILYSK